MIGKKECKIVIFHEYDAPEHYKGLYSKAEEYGFDIDYNVFRYVRPFIKSIFTFNFKKTATVVNSMKNLIKYMIVKSTDTIIVGIAPYNRYMHIFNLMSKKNRVIYFTSQTCWDDGEEIKWKRGEFTRSVWRKFLKDRETFCVTHFAKDAIKPYTANTCVVYHSIDLDRFIIKDTDKNTDKCTRNFIFIGKLIDWKRADWILKFMAENKQLDITMTFVGKGPLEQDVIKASEVDPRIIYLGFRDRKFIESNLHKYDYLILPSRREPFGIVLIESMCCGVVPIASNCEGAQTVIRNKENGFAFDRHKYDEFCITMHEAANLKRKIYSTISKECIRTGSLFDKKAIGDLWIDFICKKNSSASYSSLGGIYDGNIL
ncbi:MAG: glycosyltransferase family 4 protein [Clostridia bacterium]|nr:glycosyltransferase family 4 protein [Clostridia bacterium]